MPTWEDLIRQNAGLPIQQAANRLGQATDELVDPRLEALKKLAASQGAQMPSGNAGGVVPNAPVPQQAPPMGGGGGGMGSSMSPGAGTVDEIQAHNKALLDMYNQRTQDLAPPPEEDMSGYKKVDRFSNLKSKLNDDEDEE